MKCDVVLLISGDVSVRRACIMTTSFASTRSRHGVKIDLGVVDIEKAADTLKPYCAVAMMTRSVGRMTRSRHAVDAAFNAWPQYRRYSTSTADIIRRVSPSINGLRLALPRALDGNEATGTSDDDVISSRQRILPFIAADV